MPCGAFRLPPGALPCVDDGRPAYQRIRPIGVVIVIVLYGAVHFPVELPAPWHALVVSALHTAVTMQAIAEAGVAARRAAAMTARVASATRRVVTTTARRAGRWIADHIHIEGIVQLGSRNAVRRARLAAGTC
jgi:hypothetical protein